MHPILAAPGSARSRRAGARWLTRKEGLQGQMVGVYDLKLVALSLIVAAIASYTALELAGRVTASKGRASWLWLAGGAFAMGTGIWSMHFIGMLAFRLPIPIA